MWSFDFSLFSQGSKEVINETTVQNILIFLIYWHTFKGFSKILKTCGCEIILYAYHQLSVKSEYECWYHDLTLDRWNGEGSLEYSVTRGYQCILKASIQSNGTISND